MADARPSTLSDVAELAGVSLTTASKAVNGQGRIAEATRRRVLRAARQLSYAPNLLAKSLASGRASIVGVLLRDELVHRIAMPIVIGAQSELEPRAFSAILADATGEVSRLGELGILLRQQGADGLVIIGDNQDNTPSISAIVEIPCVYVHGPTTDPRDVVHVSDDFAGGAAVVRHLADLGRSRITHITGPAGSPAVRHRLEGVVHQLGEHGLRLVAAPRFGRWSQRWARSAARDLLSEVPDVDAIVCGSDQIAAAVLESISAAGRKVPDDVAITGYDNWAVFAQETDPGLTTVDMELAHLGAAAVRDLLAIVGGDRPGGGTRLHPGTLIVRGSTRKDPP
ncbi:MAG: LacI family DNA-binding transcriptional regulator [Actinomycetota bacterium]|nr:LacI family DNA-binding transcriptional regulator [Actinomycetota bacterium]